MRAVVAGRGPGVPIVRGGRYVVTRNDGTQNQDVWFVADSLDELRAGGRVLVDPNTLSSDGTRSLTSFSVSCGRGPGRVRAQRRRQRLGDLPPARPGHRGRDRRRSR